MIKWEPFDSRKKYLEIGSNSSSNNVINCHTPRVSDLRPRLKHNYRGHSVSVWLSLLPQLEMSGSYQPGGGGPHGMLTGPTWGLVRNTTSFPGVQQISLNDKVRQTPVYSINNSHGPLQVTAGCQESVVMTTTDVETSESSQLNLSNMILVSLVAGTGLFIVNTVILGEITINDLTWPVCSSESLLQEVRPEDGAQVGQGRGQGGELQHGVSQQHGVSPPLTAHHPPPPAYLQHPRADLQRTQTVGPSLLLPPVQELLHRKLLPPASCWPGRRSSPLLAAPGGGDTRPRPLQQPRTAGEHHLLGDTRYDTVTLQYTGYKE